MPPEPNLDELLFPVPPTIDQTIPMAIQPTVPPRAQVTVPVLTTPKRAQSDIRARGYTGDFCTDCGSDRMRRNGTCLMCEACGSTSGCS